MHVIRESHQLTIQLRRYTVCCIQYGTKKVVKHNAGAIKTDHARNGGTKDPKGKGQHLLHGRLVPVGSWLEQTFAEMPLAIHSGHYVDSDWNDSHQYTIDNEFILGCIYTGECHQQLQYTFHHPYDGIKLHPFMRIEDGIVWYSGDREEQSHHHAAIHNVCGCHSFWGDIQHATEEDKRCKCEDQHHQGRNCIM